VPATSRRTLLAYLQLFGVSCLWGGNFVVAKLLLQYWPPDRFAGSRIAFAAILLGAVATLRGQRWRLGARAWGTLAAAGAIGIGLNNALLYGGLRYTSAAHGSLIMALSPVGTAVALRLWDREPFTRGRALAVALGAAGAAIVVLPAGGGVRPFAAGAGDIAVFGAMLCSSLSFLFLKRGLETVDPVSATAVTLAAGALVLLPPSLGEHMAPGAGMGWVLALLCTSAVFSMGLGMLWWNAGVAVVGAARTVIFNDVVPAITLLLGAEVLHAPITPRDVSGFLLIAGAIVCTVSPDRARRRPGPGVPVLPDTAT